MQQLPLQALQRREDVLLFAGDRVSDFLLVLEVVALCLDVANTLDAPSDCKVGLFVLPVLDKCNAPDASSNGVEWTVSTEEQPCTKAESSRDRQEGEVGLGEGEVEGNLLAHAVANVVEILGGQEVLRAPLFDPLLVVDVVVQCEDALDVLPFALLGCNTGTAFALRVCDELVDDTQAFGLSQWLSVQGVSDLFLRCSGTHTMHPVTHTTAVDLAEHVIFTGDFAED